MASVKGREKSKIRFFASRRTMAVKAHSKYLARAVATEVQRLDKHIPSDFDPMDIQRGEFLTSVLLSPELRVALAQGGRSFGIVWHPTTVFAEGPSIEPFAHIFDRFVHGHWAVRVVNDIDGLGNTGWLFERS